MITSERGAGERKKERVGGGGERGKKREGENERENHKRVLLALPAIV